MQTKSSIELPQLLSQAEFCSYADKSEAWAERARIEGTGPRFVKIGRTVRYRLSDIQEWIDSNSRRSTSSPGRHSGGA